ncbi:MAG: hypothetical protein KAJ32_03550 [Gammaproteobacteria bacterium]|nr:hypothetical protein [Gammaproteobacteria bacterium]
MSVLQKLLALLILKAAPQDLPYSQKITVRFAVAYVFSGLVVLQTTLNPDDMLAGLFLGLFIQYVFTYAVLRALNRSARFVQTFCAILGVGILFNLLSWPVFFVLDGDITDESLKSSMSLLFLLLISWEVLVKAHIFRHALEMKMYSALALSFSLFFISVALSQLFFPAETAG